MMATDETYEYLKQRIEMVRRQLAGRGIRDHRVLDAMAEVPREQFVPRSIRDAAYDDRALPVECNQTISQPYIVAKMSEMLELEPTHRVLEIGTGTGYQTAILAHLAQEVFTIERHAELSVLASDRLSALGFTNIRYRCGDGSVGWEDAAPFDRIVVTAGAPETPHRLTAQLAEGGRLVIPVGDESTQTLYAIRRKGYKYLTQTGIPCRFVKLIGEQGWRAVT